MHIEQAIGLTRFSVVTEQNVGNFRATRQLPDYEQAIGVILSDRRLAQRFALFEAFTLPSIRALMQKHASYLHFIAFSDRLPPARTERLKALTRDLARVRLLEVGRHGSIADTFRTAVAETATGPTYTFRLDDDDALASDYFDIVRAAVDGIAHDVAVSLDDGFVLEPVGTRYRLERKTTPLNAFGLGLVSTEPRTIFDLGNHTKIASRIEVVHVRGRRAWVCSAHEHSDLKRRIKGWARWLSWPASRIQERLGPSFSHIRLAE